VDFSRKLLRGEKPDLLLEADATDPAAVGFAMSAINQLALTVVNRTSPGAGQICARALRHSPSPRTSIQPGEHQPVQHRAGLMAVILTMRW